ncbi:MAG: hypothetical protein AB1896_20580, partial [Thermodesulfobacteriota bacterium]
MTKVILLIVVGILLGLGVPIFLKEWGLVRPDRKPKPNIRRTWVRQIALPVGAAIVLCLLAWVGLSLLFSPQTPPQPEVSNAVTRPLPEVKPGVHATTPPGEPAAPPVKEREKLVADTPLVKAALGALPVSSPFNRVGLRLGQKYPAVASAGTTPPTTAPTPAPEPAPSPTTPPEPAPQPAP